MQSIEPQMVEAMELMTNSMRAMELVMPGYFGSGNTKHTSTYQEFGWPVNPAFQDFWKAYKRNPVASGAINKTVGKTWQTDPYVLEEMDGSAHPETPRERQVRETFERVRMWAQLRQTDKRSLVGKFSAAIFRFADDKRFHEPVEGKVPGGPNGLVGLIPVYEGQLTVQEFDEDENSPSYGMPTLYQYNEASVSNDTNTSQVGGRQFSVHPDRIHIWSETRDMFGEYSLEAGLNSLLDLEKISGSGAEGFWKNAKNAPILNADKGAKPETMAKMMGLKSAEDVPEELNRIFEDWQRGFDKMVMLQGIDAKTLDVTLPRPREFADISMMMFACSYGIPFKILMGNQTGERASTEDANEWAETCMARRSGIVVPNIMDIVHRLVEVGVMPESPTGWYVDWADLTELSFDEKVSRAEKMASVNQKNQGRGQVYGVDEIREVTGHEAIDVDGEDPDAEGEE